MNIKWFGASLINTIFSQPPEIPQTMVGVLQCNSPTCIPSATGPSQYILEIILSIWANIGEQKNTSKIPEFREQQQMLKILGLDHKKYTGINELIHLDAAAGNPVDFNNILEVISIEESLDKRFCFVLCDQEKIKSEYIFFRSGYAHEAVTIGNKDTSLHSLPVFGTKDKAFASPFLPFNLAPIDQQTKNILILIFSMNFKKHNKNNDLKFFSKKFEEITKRFENEGKLTILNSFILNGYPNFLNLNNNEQKTLLIYKPTH